LELPPAFLTLYQLTTLGIYHEEKQKNKNHDYQKQEQQTNKMLDAMYLIGKKTNEILSL